MGIDFDVLLFSFVRVLFFRQYCIGNDWYQISVIVVISWFKRYTCAITMLIKAFLQNQLSKKLICQEKQTWI